MKKNIFNFFSKAIPIGVFLLGVGTYTADAQTKVYANNTTGSNIHVDTPTEALNGNETFAKLNSYGGVALNLGSYTGDLTLNYTTPIAATEEYYLRLTTTGNNLLGGLLGGGLGQLLSTVVGGLVLGNHYMQVDLYNTSVSTTTPLLTALTNTTYSNTLDRMRIVQDKAGHYYMRIKSPSAYNRVVLKDVTNAVLLGVSNSTNVYNGFYFTGSTNCVDMMTYYDVSSNLLTLGVAGLGTTGVTNAQNAIDDSTTTASNIGMGVLSVAGSVSQSFILPTTTANTKDIQVMLHMGNPALLSVGIAEGVFIEAYNNGVLVSSQQVNSAFLGADLLGLVNQGQKILVRYKPTGSYDEVKVTVKGLANVGIAKTVDVYDVAIVNSQPDVNQAVCTVNGTFNLNTIVPGYSASNTYKYYTYQGAEVTTPTTVKPGSYLVKGVTAAGYCANQYVYITATQTEQYTITGRANHSVAQGTSFTFPQYTTDLPNVTAANIKIYDINGAQVTGPVSFPQLGTYYYTVKAINNAGTCEVVKRLTVYVYDQATCGFRYEKYHATNTTDWGTVSLLGIPLGAINDRAKAGDSDLSTFATISNIVSLVGIGTTYQDLKFAAPVTAGTPVTVKIGQTFSLAQVIGGITVVGLDASGNPIGNLQSVGDAALLDLLVGDNVFEYTFTPTATNGSQPAYQGVRVLLGSVLGLANNMNVYGAYINRNVPVQDNTGNCTIDQNVVVNGAVIPGNTQATLTLNNTAQDVLWGVQDPGLGLATSLSSVLYPYQAVDNNLDTYAVFNTAVSVLNKQTLTAKFKQVARPGDEVRIIIGSQNIGILNLNLLADFKIQRYMGDAPVGDLLSNQDFSLVDLNVLGLLGSNPSRKAIIVSAIDVPFDRVEISHTKLAAVQLLGEYTYIYDVAVIPNLEFDNIISTGGRVDLCLSQPLSIEKLDNCTGYIVSFAHKVTTAGVDSYVDIPGSALTVVSDQNGVIKYTLTQTYSSYGDALYLKIQSTRSGCPFGETQYFNVKVEACESKTIVNPMIRSRMIHN